MSYKDRIEKIYCKMCGREIPDKRCLERHHLTPVAKGGKETDSVCIDCGDQIHMLFTNNELRDVYNSIEKLKEHPAIQKWIGWIRSKKEFGVCMKKKKRK